MLPRLPPQGVALLAISDIANSALQLGGSYLLAASAGPAQPKDFKHDDGGVYNGEWRALKKQGLGVYTWVAGAGWCVRGWCAVVVSAVCCLL